ncbi:isocitrate/isopropylmalate family dehydrogenase, partial [Neisseria meningitidis]|nr:isocitrate/isopropylmalate family dehydrogenase [Neisseria meningitidis]
MRQEIKVENGGLKTPNNPVFPVTEGDATCPDIWAAAKRVLDAVVKKAYKGVKEIAWKDVLAGEKAVKQTGELLPLV